MARRGRYDSYDVTKEKIFWQRDLASVAGNGSVINVAIKSYNGKAPKVSLSRKHKDQDKPRPIGWIAGYELLALLPLLQAAADELSLIEDYRDVDANVAEPESIKATATDSTEETEETEETEPEENTAPAKARRKSPLSGLGRRNK